MRLLLALRSKRMVILPLVIVGVQLLLAPRLAAQWPMTVPSIEASLVSFLRGNESPPPRFQMIILRAIGNALPPRHSPEQTMMNLDFTLKHEVLPLEVTRHWFVNKLVDPDVERQVIERLKSANETFTVVPFYLKEFDRIPLSFEYLDDRDTIHSRKYRRSKAAQQAEIEQILQHDRILYTMDVNGVRNEMLRYGKTQTNADYIALLDGNCFVTKNALKAIRSSIQSHAGAKYFVSPTDRLTGANEDLLNDSYVPNAVDEAQLIFHRSSVAEFNPRLRYGRRDKVELLNRMKIPGHWRRFRKWDEWERPLLGPQNVPDKDPKVAVPTAGWVSRLQSGNVVADQPGQMDMRFELRFQAVPLLMDRLELRAAQELHNFSSSSLLFYNASQLEKERQQWRLGKLISPVTELLEMANKSLEYGPWTVMDKKEHGCGLSGDCHDYFYPAPYQWPQLDDAGQVDWSKPFVRNNDVRVPGTHLFEHESDKYDFSRLTAMQHNTTLLALAYSFTQDQTYAAKAADNIKHWFLNPETRMNPHLNYAEAIWKGTDKGTGGGEYGILQMKNLHFFLDAVRIVEASGALSQADQEELRQWFRDYLKWLLESRQGRKIYIEGNHHGLYYDIQVIAVAAYANDLPRAIRTMHRAVARLETHMDAQGALPHSFARTDCEDSQIVTLQGWTTLARMSSRIGVNVWDRFRVNGRSALCRAIEFANPLFRLRKPCQDMSGAVDPQHWWPLWYDAKQHCPTLIELDEVHNEWISSEGQTPPADLYGMPSMYPRHSGIAPFWNLGS